MSTAEIVAAAVKGVIEGMASLPAGAAVMVRKRPAVAKDDGLPLVLVTVGEDGDAEPLWAGAAMISYPVAVALVVADPNTLAESADVRAFRKELAGLLWSATGLLGVAGANDIRQGGKAPYDPTALAANYGWSVQVFTVEVIESRG